MKVRVTFARCAAGVLALASACRAPTPIAPPLAPPVVTVVAVPAEDPAAREPPFVPSGLARSTSTTWASAARSSVVAAPLLRFSALVRTDALTTAPRALLVNDAGDRLAVDYGETYAVRERRGALQGQGRKLAGDPLVLGAAQVFGAGVSGASSDSDVTWALRVSQGEVISVVQHASHGVNRHVALRGGGVAEVFDQTPITTSVVVARVVGEGPFSVEARREARIEGPAVGAIAADGRVTVATGDRRLLVYDAMHDAPDRVMKPVTTRALGFVPRDLALVDGKAVLFESVPGATVVHALDANGAESWQASVPFVAHAPPIDGGAGRVYVAGDGLAAVLGGKILWSDGGKGPFFVTALASGALLVAVGPELRVVGKDGARLTTLRVPEGDTIVAPPAVAADGEVWVATAKGIYVVVHPA